MLEAKDHFNGRGYSKDDHGGPARRLRLWDRGLIHEGMSADLFLFDPNKIKDQNYYIQPKIFPVGIRVVWVKRKLIYREF